MKYWYLDIDGQTVREGTYEQWMTTYTTQNRIVKQWEGTLNGNGILVSGVFIGMGDYPFETMLFVNAEGDAQMRWMTWDETLEAVDQAIEIFVGRGAVQTLTLDEDASVEPPKMLSQDETSSA